MLDKKQERFQVFLTSLPLPISREEEAETMALAKQGDQNAIDKIIVHNLRFIVSIAKYIEATNTHSLSVPYLVSEGIDGFYKALERFRIEDGNKFISYAVWRIRITMQNANAKLAGAIKVDRSIIRLVEKAKKIKDKTYAITGEVPSNDDVAEIMNVTSKFLTNTLFLENKYGIKSMDAPLGDDAYSDTLADIFPSNDIDPAIATIKKEEYNNLYNRISQLPQKHQYVLIHSLGLYNNDSRKNPILAQELGCDTSEVAKLKKEAYTMLSRLAHNQPATKQKKKIMKVKPKKKLVYTEKPIIKIIPIRERELPIKNLKPEEDLYFDTTQVVDEVPATEAQKDELPSMTLAPQANFVTIASNGGIKGEQHLSADVFLGNMRTKYNNGPIPKELIDHFIHEARQQAKFAYAHCDNEIDFFLSAQLYIDTYMENTVKSIQTNVREYEENSESTVVGELGETPDFVFTSLLNRKFIGIDIPKVSEKQIDTTQQQVFKTLLETQG